MYLVHVFNDMDINLQLTNFGMLMENQEAQNHPNFGSFY